MGNLGVACFQHSYVAAEVLKNKFPDATVRVVARPLGDTGEHAYTIIEFKDGEHFLVDIFPGERITGEVAKLAGPEETIVVEPLNGNGELQRI